MDKLDKYEVVLRSKTSGDRISLCYFADNFSHAEEQAIDSMRHESFDNDEIVEIKKDYAT